VSDKERDISKETAFANEIMNDPIKREKFLNKIRKPTIERRTSPAPAIGESTRKMMENIRKNQQAEREYREEDLKYKQAMIKATQKIESNTALLPEMILLLQQNNERQEEILEIIKGISDIGQSSSPEEAESKYKKVMGKLIAFKDQTETFIFLKTMAISTYETYQKVAPPVKIAIEGFKTYFSSQG
jgi:hypothetical protein